MLKIIVVRNPVQPENREIIDADYVQDKPLKQYISSIIAEWEGTDFVVSVNGGIIDPQEIDGTVLCDGDFIILMPVMGKDFFDILKTVLFVALMSWAGSWSLGLVEKGLVNKFWAGVYVGAIGLVGGAVLNAIIPTKQPDLGFESEMSTTYGWSGPTPTEVPGTPVGMPFGRVSPSLVLLQRHVSAEGNNQYLNLLYSCGEGPVDAVENIKIAQNNIENYEDAEHWIRLGTNDQEVIENFHDTITDYSLAYELETGVWRTHTTQGNAIQGFEVMVQLPNGLYYMNDDGALGQATVAVEAQYKLSTGSTWTPWLSETIVDAKNSALFRSYRKDNLPEGQYDVRIRCVSKSGTTNRYATAIWWTQLSEIVYDDFCYPNKVLLGLRIRATNQLSNADPQVTCEVVRSKVWVWNPYLSAYEEKRASNPFWAAYHLAHKCRRMKNIQTGADEFVVRGIPARRIDYDKIAECAAYADEIVDGDYRFVLNLFLDGNISMREAFEKISMVGRGAVLPRGTKLSVICDKPAPISQIFSDGNIKPGSVLGEFQGTEGRAKSVEVFFWNREKNWERDMAIFYSPEYEEDRFVQNPIQLTYQGISGYAHAYREAAFLSRCNTYKKRTKTWECGIDTISSTVGDVVGIQTRTSRWGNGGRIVSATSNSVKLDQKVLLTAETQYKLYVRLLNDELVIKDVQPVLADTETDTLTLTEPFAEIPETFDLFIFTQNIALMKILSIVQSGDHLCKVTAEQYFEEIYDDNIAIPQISYSDLSIKSLTVSAAETYPRPAGGNANLSVSWIWPRDSRVSQAFISVGRNSGSLQKVQTVLVGDLTGTTISVGASGTWVVGVVVADAFGSTIAQGTASITIDTTLPGNVSNITLEENTFLLKDGTALSDLLVTFVAPENPVGLIYQAYYELDSSGAWTYFGQAMPAGFTIKALKNAASVKVKIVSVNANTLLASSGLVSSPYSITGKSAPPSDVAGLQYQQSTVDKTQIHLAWNQITDVDFKAVELRIGGSAWGVDDTVLATVYGFAHDITIVANGTYVIRAKAIDWSGNYSTGVAVLSMPLIVTPSNVANLAMSQRDNDRTKAIFTWSAVADTDLSHYEIRQGLNWESATLIATQLKATSYEHFLTVESSQTYLVKAVSVAGMASIAAASLSVTPVLKPAMPAGLSLVQSASNKAQLVASWQPVTTSDFATYEVCIGSAWSDANKVVTKETTYGFAISAPGNHTILVRSKSIAGWVSNPAGATLNNVSVNPSNVSGFASEQNPLDRRMIRFNWGAVTDPDLSHYEIRRGSNWDAATVVKSNIKVNYHDEVLAAPVSGQKYLIKAFNASGFGSTVAGETLCTYTLAATKPVSGNATIDPFDKTYIVVLWDRVTDTDLTGYEVRDGAEALLAFVKESTLRYKISNSGSYTFKIYATNVGGNRSAALTITVNAVMEPEDVTEFAANQDAAAKAKIRLSWNPVGDKDLSHYVIKEGASWAAGTMVGLKVFGNFFDTTIAEERTYQYWIKAVTIAGKESVVAASVSNMFSMEPTAPTGLTVTADPADKTTLMIQWNGIGDADLTEYEVRAGMAWDAGTVIAKTKETKALWKPQETELVNIMLAAKNAAGFLSDVVSVQFGAVLEPQNVANFTAVQNGESVLLTWDRATEVDVIGYEIREGSSFAGGSALVVTGLSETTYTVPVSTESLKKYHIKAINRAGYYSDQAATSTVLVSNLLPKNIIQSYDEITLQSGMHSNTEFGISAINFSNLPGRFSDYPTTRFNEIGGASVLKLKRRGPALTFTRNSVAYRNDGKQVAVNEPRFEKNLTVIRPAVTNLIPADADNFMTGWIAFGGEGITVTDYPMHIDGIGNVVAKRIRGNGAGSNRIKYYIAATGRPNPHTDTCSVWAMALNNNVSLSLDGATTGITTVPTTMQRVSNTKLQNDTDSAVAFLTNSTTDILDVVVYQPMINDGATMGEYTPPGTTRPAVLDGTPLGLRVEGGTTNLMPAGADDFVTGWTAYQGEGITVTDYPVYIPEFGTVVAKRIRGNGAGSNTIKYLRNVAAYVNGTVRTTSVWLQRLSGTARIGTNMSGGQITISDSIMARRVITATGTESANSHLQFNTVAATDQLDIVVYGPQAENLAYVTSPMPPQGVRAVEAPTVPASVMNKDAFSFECDVDLGTTAFPTTIYRHILDVTNPDYNNRVVLYFYNNTLAASIKNTATKTWTATTGSLVGSHRIGFAYESGAVELWLDGIKLNPTTSGAGTGIIAAIGATCGIGYEPYQGLYHLNGNISQVRFSNKRRDASEMSYTGPPQADENTTLFAPLVDNLEQPYLPSGTYTVVQKDTGQIITANLSIDFISTALLTGGVNARLQYRTSTDGVNFTAWADFKPVLATFRYLEARAELSTSDSTKTPEVNTFDIAVDVPDTQKAGTATISATGGTTINYGHTYYNTPHVVATAIGAGLRAEIISVGVSSCVVKVYNAAGVEQSGAAVKVSWSSLGY